MEYVCYSIKSYIDLLLGSGFLTWLSMTTKQGAPYQVACWLSWVGVGPYRETLCRQGDGMVVVIIWEDCVSGRRGCLSLTRHWVGEGVFSRGGEVNFLRWGFGWSFWSTESYLLGPSGFKPLLCRVFMGWRLGLEPSHLDHNNIFSKEKIIAIRGCLIMSKGTKSCKISRLVWSDFQ